MKLFKKTLLVLLAINFLPILSFAQQDQLRLTIANWNSDIPITAQLLSEHMEYYGSYYNFETDEGTCGGDVDLASVLEYRLVSTTDNVSVHIVKIGFELTLPVDYCSAEKVVTCEVRYKIIDSNTMEFDTWTCEE